MTWTSIMTTPAAGQMITGTMKRTTLNAIRILMTNLRVPPKTFFCLLSGSLLCSFLRKWSTGPALSWEILVARMSPRAASVNARISSVAGGKSLLASLPSVAGASVPSTAARSASSRLGRSTAIGVLHHLPRAQRRSSSTSRVQFLQPPHPPRSWVQCRRRRQWRKHFCSSSASQESRCRWRGNNAYRI